MVIFATLLVGVYSAYKSFSGMDPLKIDPQSLVQSLIKSKNPGQFIAVFQSLKLNQKVLGEKSGIDQNKTLPQNTPTSNLQPVFSFVVLGDSHNEGGLISKALEQAKVKNSDLKFAIGMGDYTDVGTIEELKKAKEELDLSGLRYFLTVGDHDLWDARDKNLPPTTNFNEVFGPTYQSFTYDNFRFLIINNADNYTGIDPDQFKWIDTQLLDSKQAGEKGVYAFMHEPLYHPSSDHVMGMVNADLKKQAGSLVHTLKDGGMKMVFYGHVHFFSQYSEPESNLPMTVVGALTSKANAQASRYAIVSVYEDGSLGVEDVEVKLYN